MSLKTKLGKADYEALEDSLKTFYIADGDGFKLDADYEDVTGLKNKNAELLGKIKDAEKAVKQFEGLDPEAARAALAAQQKAAEDKLKEEGDFDKLKQEYEARVLAAEKAAEEKIAAAEAKAQQILATLKTEHLSNVLTKKGVDPKRVNGLVRLVGDDVDIVPGERGFQLRKAGGVVGDEQEFDALVNSWKSSPDTDYFFQPTVVSGSGASGSEGSAGGGKTMPRTQFEGLSPQEQMAFSIGGGKLTD